MSTLAPSRRRPRPRLVRGSAVSTVFALGLVVSVLSDPSVAADVAPAVEESGPTLAECRDRATDATPVAAGCAAHGDVLKREAERRQAEQRQAEQEQTERQEAQRQAALRQAAANETVDLGSSGNGDENGNGNENSGGDNEPPGGGEGPPDLCELNPELPICDDEEEPPPPPDPCVDNPELPICDDEEEPPPPPDPCVDNPTLPICDDDGDEDGNEDEGKDRDKPSKPRKDRGGVGNAGGAGGAGGSGLGSTVGTAEGVLPDSAPAACGGSVACQAAAPVTTTTSSSSGEGLPQTGAPESDGLVAAGLALMLAGGVLLRPRRATGRHRAAA